MLSQLISLSGKSLSQVCPLWAWNKQFFVVPFVWYTCILTSCPCTQRPLMSGDFSSRWKKTFPISDVCIAPFTLKFVIIHISNILIKRCKMSSGRYIRVWKSFARSVTFAALATHQLRSARGAALSFNQPVLQEFYLKRSLTEAKIWSNTDPHKSRLSWYLVSATF